MRRAAARVAIGAASWGKAIAASVTHRSTGARATGARATGAASRVRALRALLDTQDPSACRAERRSDEHPSEPRASLIVHGAFLAQRTPMRTLLHPGSGHQLTARYDVRSVEVSSL